MTILTLYVPQKILVKRINSRLLVFLSDLLSVIIVRRRQKDISVLLKETIRTWKKRRLYKRGFSESLYEKWFDYCVENSKATHWVSGFAKFDSMIPFSCKADIVESFGDENFLIGRIK